MNKDSITLKYEGPALKNGDIEIAQLGPALIAINEIFAITNRLVNGPDRKIAIKVQSFKKGSFDINLSVLTSAVEQAMLLFNKDYITGALNLYQILGIVSASGFGLIALCKKLKGQPATQVAEDKVANTVTLQFNNELIVVNKTVFNLYCDTDIAKYLADLTAPVASQGVESLEFVRNNETTQKISKEEVSYFQSLKNSHEEIETITKRVNVTFKKISIPMSLSSKFSANGMEFVAKVTDKDFNEKISKGLRLGLADSLDVDLETTTTRVGDKTLYEYKITKVHDHTLGMTQTEMSLNSLQDEN